MQPGDHVEYFNGDPEHHRTDFVGRTAVIQPITCREGYTIILWDIKYYDVNMVVQIRSKNLRPAEKPYDPSQQGDRDDDI